MFILDLWSGSKLEQITIKHMIQYSTINLFGGQADKVVEHKWRPNTIDNLEAWHTAQKKY